MGDYESILYDVKLDFNSLCDRINRGDDSLCDENWYGITYGFDLDWIEAIYKNIKVDDMFDVVTELICRQYTTMVTKGQIDDSVPHINETGMIIDYPRYYLNQFRDKIRSQRVAEELELKTRCELKQKMRQMKKGLRDSAYNESTKSLNLDILMNNAIADFMQAHTATDEDIDEIFDSPVTIGKDECNSVFDVSTQPQEFISPEAEHLMQKLLKAGLLDANWQPVNLSITERGYLADEIASRLQIKAKWKVLGKLWNVKSETLRQGKNKAIGQAKTQIFIAKLKNILD